MEIPMAKIIVTADHTTDGATDGTPAVLLEESVYAVHLSTGHAAMQLIERLGWALSDAEELERRDSIRARPDRRASGRSRSRRPLAAERLRA
jgi:hypothetical protein